ncbi:MAG: immunoglobulin domain-containing protein [Opitutaceae bacterium]
MQPVRSQKLRINSCAVLVLLALAPMGRAQSTISVDATKPIRVVDDRMFGVNTAIWDGVYSDSQTLATLQGMDARFLRYPGGSAADDYVWQLNQNTEGTTTWSVNTDQFAAQALAINAQAVITANYGTGTPQMAASWVQYTNVTKRYGFKYWEIGNECYGTWEDDAQAVPHDPYTYAMRAVQYIQAMKAVDPTIKIGMVAVPGEDSYVNNSNHPATNPVTKVSHNGWTPVMLTTLKSQGVYPDFLIYHNYEQNEGGENDATLLQSEVASTVGNNTWRGAAADLRTQLTDYLGSSGTPIELVCTENNSVSTSPGKQSVSLVNALYYADSVANLMQTEFNGMIWWDLHNGPGTSGTNESSSLYGWRLYGDYGVENGGAGTIDLIAHDKYPVYYAFRLLQHFARGGDTVITATSDSNLLSAYATERTDGSLSLLVINKSPNATNSANITVKGYTPQAAATVYSYGIPQDEYSEENAQTATAPASGYSWENSLDGWVNQSGPDVASSNYGLDAPFLYSSIGFSTVTGVTNGSYSLACTTTAADPGNSAVIQNSTAAIGSAMSTASSVSVDIYPAIPGGGTVQASIYINGINIAYQLLGTVTLNANQENTATFPVTATQRAGILASLGSGNWFQVGININAPGPLTVYFDNFNITSTVSPTPTPTPTPIAGAASSPDLAVSTLTNVGTSFTASFGPYSATVISLSVPTSAPAATSQPTSQTVASGSTAVFSFAASGAPVPTYQWYDNGTAIPSATSSTLVISGSTAANEGTYTCTATNSTGSVTSNPATLTVVGTSDPGRLVNLSCRAGVGTGANLLIAGFAVGGSGTSGQEPLLVRASGPALVPFGVGGALPDPKLQLYTGAGALLATNSGWGGSASIASTAAAVGAFAWTSPTSNDAALVTSQSAGPYTAQISGASGDTGVSLAEVYDATPAGSYTVATPRLINLSARVQVGTGGNILIAGFVIGGSTSETVLVRASGPALVPFGVTGTLSDPKLQLYTGSGTLLATNNGWGGNPQIASAASAVGAFSWSSSTSNDSAILVTLPPGAYTAQVSGASGDTGVALVEVYEDH